jgi:hypothetical protein
MRIACFVAIAGCASGALAQSGVRYRLEADSQIVEEFCPPNGPCLCPPHQFSGPVVGTFTLTRTVQGPLFTEYGVSGVDWLVMIPSLGVQRYTGSGTYRIGGEVGVFHQMQLQLSENGADPIGYDSGTVLADPQHPFPQIGISITSGLFGCRINTFGIVGTPVSCAADCDVSGSLNVADFGCFLNSFAAGDPYANCDGSTTPPVLNVADFACFLNRFAAGCS